MKRSKITDDDLRYFKERDQALGRKLAAEKSFRQYKLAKEIFEKQNDTTV